MDDIIFGCSSHSLMSSFQEMMESEFQMSMIGELTFFLGIQVKKMKQGTFVHQAKYKKDLIKKFNMTELKPVSTPMSTATSLGPDEYGEAIDQMEYRSMIDSLEEPEKVTRGGGGVNGSQSKFLKGTRPISQNQPDSPLF
jgi:isopentenyldiphosphate isomerase